MRRFVANCYSFNQKPWVIVLSFLLLCRFISMIFIPLNDTTEARYGEIARIMLETGNWVTPMQSYGEPFWAKPPLSMWLQAFSMKCFGVNAFAARLPALILSWGVLMMVWYLALRQRGHSVAIFSVVVLAGSPFFFLNAGTVMTDPALLFCLTLSMTSFWLCVVQGDRIWGYLFFVGLGLGLLAKGPLVGVLVFFPMLCWTIKQKAWGAVGHHLPWVRGTLLMACIAFPWYILAELRTPGFLNYFLMGEHLARFLEPSWQGDKYGFAHQAPLGMIWVFAMLGVLPWIIYGVLGCLRYRVTWKQFHLNNDKGWITYLGCFTLFPLLFFTAARNIIYPYTFPFLPTFALLFSEILVTVFPKAGSKSVYSVASLVGVFFIVATLLFFDKPEWVEKSQQRVIALWRAQGPSSNNDLIYWTSKLDYSARFYAQGHVKSTHDLIQLRSWLKIPMVQYLVVNERDLQEIPVDLKHELHRLESIHVSKQTLTLFEVQ